MRRKSALVTSIVVVSILLLSVLSGFIFQAIGDAIDRYRYPQSYDEYVTKYAEKCGVPEYVVYAVIKTESDFVSNAVSSAGAVGLMQILPSTFEWLMAMQKESLQDGMLYDPETNIRYGTYLLAYLYSEFNSWETAFAAYNAGYGTVVRWLEDPAYSADGKHLDSIPYSETDKYVDKVTSAIDVYKRLYYAS